MIGKLQRYNTSDFANVVATGVASAPIALGRTIESVVLALGGTSLTKAMISPLRVRANGKVIVDASATQIDKINAYIGETSDAAFLTIPFLEKAGDTDFDREIGSFDTSQGLSQVTIEAGITGATAPTLKAILTESMPQRGADGKPAPYSPIIHKLLPYPFSRANAGRLPIDLPFGPVNGATIKRIHIFHTGQVTGATVKQDGVVVHESIKAENEFEQKRWKRVPQANVYTIDFMLDGKTRDALNTTDARSLELLIDVAAAENGTVLVEYLDTLGNL